MTVQSEFVTLHSGTGPFFCRWYCPPCWVLLAEQICLNNATCLCNLSMNLISLLPLAVTGITPRSGWAVDPFGHSATMAFLLKRANLTSMLIQRVHYSIKKHFASTRSLEFMWRQAWGKLSWASNVIWCKFLLSHCRVTHTIVMVFGKNSQAVVTCFH